MTINSTATNVVDGYKLGHKKFMRDGTTLLYANLTARSGKYMHFQDSEKRVVVAGIGYFVKTYLKAEWDAFFKAPAKEVIGRFKRRVDTYLGEGAVSMDHFKALHKLGYLPIRFKAFPEGSKVSLKLPLVTVRNTHKDFAWLVTYIETVMSQELWPIITSATSAFQFLTLMRRFARETVGNEDHIPFQCHDFSARGMFGKQAAAMSGYAHLLSFSGTDTVAALDFVDDFYGPVAPGYLVGTSVPASEHSVTSLGIAVDGELETIRNWITKAYPTGIVSIVSDTIDYWRVITEYLPALETEIRARKPNGFLPGKVVVRPDSGDPVRIVCGYRDDEVYRMDRDGKQVIIPRESVRLEDGRLVETVITEEEFKGSIEVLWDKFGGTINKFGYKELDPCIGLIYGDSITINRANEILSRLQQKGFASNNIVFGVGSYTYQMVSRDTLGIAVKATFAEVDGEGVNLSKNPKTDDGTKKSATGLLSVIKGCDGYYLLEGATAVEEAGGELVTYFEDGKILINENFETIRNRVQDIVVPEAE